MKKTKFKTDIKPAARIYNASQGYCMTGPGNVVQK